MTDKTKETENKRLRESDWTVIIALWERGEVTLKELSAKFSISEAAISQGLRRRGIKRGSKAHLFSKEIHNKTLMEKEKLIEDIYIFKKRFLKYGDFLMTLTMNQITEAQKSKINLFEKKANIDTIYAATKVYKTLRNDMYHLYDLYNPDNKVDENYEFNIGIYSEEDIKLLRETQRQVDEEMDFDLDDEDFDGDE